MEKSKSSKKDRLEKLRVSLESNSGEKLHPDDEKYLKVLHSRLSKTSKESKVNVYREYKKTEGKIDSLKPRVTIHSRKEDIVETPIFIRPETEKVEVKKEVEDKELFEVKKVEVVGPEFVEVKPKETIRKIETSEKKIIKKIEEPEQKEYETLPEWEPVETKKIEQVEQEIKTEEKIEAKEDITESFILEEKPEEVKDEEKLTKREIKKAKRAAKEEERELKKKAKAEEKQKKLEAKMALNQEKPEPKEEDVFEEKSESEFKEVKETSAEESFDLESSDEETTRFEIADEKEPEHEDNMSFEEKERVLEREKQTKLDAFKDIIIIDEKTAILLYDNGFTSLDDLRSASVKDISRIKGIKRKTAKKIKKELAEIEITKENINATPKVETSEANESLVLEEEFEEISKKEEFLSEEEFMEEEKMFFEEDEEEKHTEKDEVIDVFNDIECIDGKTASLLVENGIISVDILKDASVKKLAKIDGIDKKLAKKIKKELKRKSKKTKKNSFSIADAYDKDISKEFEEPSEQISEKKEAVAEVKKIKKQKPRAKKKSKQYKREGYTLYKKDVKPKSKKPKDKKKREIYFFSKQKRNKAEPSDLPKGFEVRINRKTGVPYLRKKK